MMDGFRKEGVMTWRNECAGVNVGDKGTKKLAGAWPDIARIACWD